MAADPLVAVIGLGGVGSHCAHGLLRAGVRRMRLVDFDRVSLSSLNRHAVAGRRDVGISKVVACSEHFRAILPGCHIDARDEMFTADAAERLLEPSCPSAGRPRLVVDCIDDVNTKVDLLTFCVAHGIHVVSALGSGAKDDPTKVCVARGLRDIDNDPLATKLRKISALKGLDFSQVSFVYSSQKVQRSLLPLSDEQRAKPEEFGSVANFRLRVIPVLGTQPAAAGLAISAQVLNELGLTANRFWPQPTPAPRRNLVDKLFDSFRRNELKQSGGRVCSMDVTPAEASFLVHEVWLGRSALNPELDAFAATGIRFTLTRWDPSLPITADNVILATVAEAEQHSTPEEADPEVRQRVEAALRWARDCLALPLRLATARDTAAAVAAWPEENGASQQLPGLPESEVKANSESCAEERALMEEQLSRSSSFLGAEGHGKVRSAFVVIVGLGAVGSAAAILLARAGVGKLRLVDGGLVRASAAHAVAKHSDAGRPKVDVCRNAIHSVLPHIDVEVHRRHFKAGDEAALAADAEGRLPDVLVDCVGGFTVKGPLLARALEQNIRVISVSVPPTVASADPTRVVVASLAEVWACPAAVSLRLALAAEARERGEEAEEASSRVDVVHSQEPGLWAKPSSAAGRADAPHRLQLGVTAAAVALLRLTGGQVPQQSDPCAMNFWKKLRRGLEQQEPAGCQVPDLHGVGCVADFVWRGRSALSRSSGTKHGDLALTRWDRSRPLELGNLVLLTAEESKDHHAEAEATGSLPQTLLAALQDGAPAPADNSLLAKQLLTHEVLQRLQKHLKGASRGRGDEPGDCEEVSPQTLPTRASLPPSLELGGASSSRASGLSDRPGYSGLVGATKLVELSCLSKGTGCRILGKAEFLSPGGCQKDRVARQIIDDAEAAGLLKPGATIVEGTSGSTGISLCLAAAARGYKVHVVMPDDQASEKVQLLQRFGATVQLVRPASISSPEHYVNVARRHAEELNAKSEGGGAAVFADQFENPANFKAHYVGTGPELWEQCGGCLDAFVMSAGTGGTLAGVGRFLKERAPDIKICLADVQGSALYNKVARGVLYAPEQEERSIRRHRTDTIAEGIGADRLTANFALGLREHNGGMPGIDEAVRVSDQEALQMAHHLLAHEGLFLGSSAAVNCAAAVKMARQLRPGSSVATILCDGGQRHLTKFYDHGAWADYGLSAPSRHEATDLSFIS